MAIKYFRQNTGPVLGGDNPGSRVWAFSDKQATTPPDEVYASQTGYPHGYVEVRPSRETPISRSGVWDSRESDTPEMFAHTPPEINAAFVDPSIRHALPTMVGLALHDLGSAGSTPQVDHRLSPYSSPLAKHASRKGLVTGSPENPNMNATFGGGSQHRPMLHWTPSPRRGRAEASELQPAEVTRSKEWVRNRLRGPRKERNLGVQFNTSDDQPTLF